MHIVLGGTSGLGREIATLLRADNERVLVIGREHDQDRDGEGFRLDLYDTGMVHWAMRELDQRLNGGVLQSFIWTAGYGWCGNFADQPDVKSMVDVNFAGALPLVQWMWRYVQQQEVVSQLVIVSSTSGVRPRGDRAVYAATKHAQVGLARSLALEIEERLGSIQILLCLPGSMKTPFWQGREPDDYATFNDPHKVAAKIVATMKQQTTTYAELELPRGEYM